MFSYLVFLLLLFTGYTGALTLADGRTFFCHNTGMTRNAANSYCRGRGMTLPIVKDLPTANRIVKHCKTQHYGFYVDAVRDSNTNNYRWRTGGIIDDKDPIWHKIEPTRGVNEKCVEFLLYGSINKWALNDVPCHTKRSVVCEQKPPTKKALALADGRKFFCLRNGLNRNAANSLCRSRGMALPLVKDIPTVKRIANHCNIKGSGQGFWVDAKRENTGNFYRWSTSSVIDNKDPIWHDHNPSYDGSCVEYHLGGAPKHVWALNDYACNKHRWVVCEQRPW